MARTNTLRRIKQLETTGRNHYWTIANEAYQSGRITAEQRELYLNYIEAGNTIPPIMWIDTDTELMQVIRKLGIYPNSVWLD
jgi:hypothetical protein